MRDYITMNILKSNPGFDDLVSESLKDFDEACHFAKCFSHNYNCNTKVEESLRSGEYVVFAYNVSVVITRPNIDRKVGSGIFANWVFESRKWR